MKRRCASQIRYIKETKEVKVIGTTFMEHLKKKKKEKIIAMLDKVLLSGSAMVLWEGLCPSLTETMEILPQRACGARAQREGGLQKLGR